MQPNQQNQDYNQPQQPGNLPYQVPDYLQLEPAPDLSAKRNRVKRVVIVLTIVLVVLAVGLLLYSWFKDAPERDMYTSIGRSMQAKYLKRTITQKYPSENRMSHVIAESDFTDLSSPKSIFQYSNSVTLQQGPNQDAKQFVIKGNQVMINDQKLFEKIDSIDGLTTGKAGDLEIGKWFGVSSNNTRFATDAKFLKSYINSPLSFIPFGLTDGSKSNDLLQKIKDDRVYRIISSGSGEINSKQFITYDIEFSPEALAKVYESLSGTVTKEQIDESVSSFKIYSHIKLWVDRDSNLIAKIFASQQNDSGNEVSTYEVDYEYPNELTVAAPKNVVDI